MTSTPQTTLAEGVMPMARPSETGSHASHEAPSGFDPARGILDEFESEVYFLLHKFGVRKHYLASSASKATRYAVFANGEQITEPKPSAEARAERDMLTAKAIGALVSKGVMTACPPCDDCGAEMVQTSHDTWECGKACPASCGYNEERS